MATSSAVSGDGRSGALPSLAAESASDAELRARLEEARVLLRQAAHLCRYHRPGLERDIAAFLDSGEDGG